MAPPPTDVGLAAPAGGLSLGRPRPWLAALRRPLALLGPAWLVAVGYVDPGNWATDLAAGSRHGYALLWVVVAASIAAMILQSLAARLGLATGRDLAQLTAERCPPALRWVMWILAEAAICACDLAELIGAAIALKLLFGLPLALGVAMTGLDVLIILAFRPGGRGLGLLVTGLLAIVAGCFVCELALARPDWLQALGGLAPRPSSLQAPGALYLAAGIVGATVMPHNLYLHSSLAKDRRRSASFLAKDTAIALALAMLVNMAIVLLAAAAFHGHTEAASIEDAYRLLQPLLGPAAALLFALALLAAGQSSSLTATMAGQTVMEGFVRLRLPPAARRLLTRGLALGPALTVAVMAGDGGLGRLLVGSQVLLSLQLPFAMIPLLLYAGSRTRMGTLAPPRWLLLAGWTAAGLILAMNAAMLAVAALGG